MPLLTTQQEYDQVRSIIQALMTAGTATVSMTSLDGMMVQYSQQQLPQLQAREETLAKRLTTRNHRKRTTAGFAY